MGADGAKLLLELPDGRQVETVVVVANRRRRGSAAPTVCISSQAGCAMACRFCDTGLLGGKPGLAAGNAGTATMLSLPSWAILEQVLHAEALIQREGLASPSSPAAIVFMGMGEPLLNYRNVLTVARVLCESVPPRRVTLSTVGVSPRIDVLAHETPPGLRLALSLHAPTQELREQLLPRAARAWPLPQLLRSVRAFETVTGIGVLLEYILIRGVNDQDHHADALADLIERETLRCAGVNLIPYNPTAAGSAAGFEPPSDARCKAFRRRLRDGGAPNATVRFSTKLGRGLSAACGQLGLRKVQ